MDVHYAKELLERNIEVFNITAEEFSQTTWDPWQELKPLTGYIKDGDQVLDIGCGNGRFLELIQSKKCEYTGIDASKKLIDIAKSKYRDRNFQIANALSLPFPDNSFDKTIAIAVLHHIPSEVLRKRLILEIKRVLKPGGLAILTVWDLCRKDTILLVFKYYLLKLVGRSQLDFGDALMSWGKNKIMKYYHFFTQKEIRKLLQKNGFTINKFGVLRGPEGKRSNFFVVAQK